MATRPIPGVPAPWPHKGIKKGKKKQKAKRPNPGTIEIPNYMSDYYDNLVDQDPLYRQSLADLEAMGVSSAAQRQAAVRTALIKFGFVPGGLTDPYGDIDPTTQALASQATTSGMSITAQLERARQARRNDLAARGLLDSSERQFQDQESQNEAAMAQQELLDYLTGLAQAYATSQASLAQQKTGSAEEALARQLAMNPQKPDPTASLIRGSGWYKNGGKLYNQAGQVIDIAAQRQSYLAKIRELKASGMPLGKLKQTLAWRRLQVLQKYI